MRLLAPLVRDDLCYHCVLLFGFRFVMVDSGSMSGDDVIRNVIMLIVHDFTAPKDECKGTRGCARAKLTVVWARAFRELC